MKKIKTAPQPVSDSPQSSVSSDTHDRIHTWISVLAIVLAVIIIAVAAAWIIRTRHQSQSRLTDKDVQVVDQFFKENPPAQLAPSDFDYLTKTLTGKESASAPASEAKTKPKAK